MKKYTKKLLALLLAICSLVSFAMPTVFASGNATPDTPANLQVDFAADFKAIDAATDKYAHNTAAIWQGIRDGYPDTYKWKFLEDASGKLVNTAYPVRVFGNSKLFQMRPNAADAWGYTPMVVKAPATGNYTLTVNFQDSASAPDAQKFAAYLYEMPADGITKSNLASVTTAHTPMLEVNYESQKGTVDGTTTTVMREGREYVLVFAIYSDAANETAEIRGFSLNFVDANVEDPTVPKVYSFENPDLAGTLLQNYAATLNEAYIAGTSNWRYEAASNASQFRVKDTHPGVTSDGNNKYESNGFQLIAGDKWWYALRIKSPGEGKYDLTFTNVKSEDGAQAKVYFFKASAVEEALGENAAAYIQAMAADPYQDGGTTEAFKAYKEVVNGLIKNSSPAMNIDCVEATESTGKFRFVKDTEYVMVLQLTGEDTIRAILKAMTATYSEDQSVDPEQPVIPEGPGYTDGLYDFYQGREAGETLAEGIETLAAMYEAGTINWKYETKGGNLNLEKITYEGKTQSLRAISAPDWWLAVRIKAPAEDGQYNIKMTHGAGGQGAQSGSIFVIPGDTPTEQIFRIASQKGAAMTTDWYYGENTGDIIGGRVSTTGTVNLKGGEEYIVVFLPTSTSALSTNGFFYAGQLETTRVGDYVEEEVGGEGVNPLFYEFYDWDNPGQFLIHYRTEEELNRKIVTEKIAQEYADGTRNWCYEKSNGFAQFSTGTPYMQVTIGETQYFCIKIKSPGTGTYELTYNYLAIKDSTAALRGSIYILPYEAGTEYAIYRDEANFADAVISAEYYANKTEIKQTKGTYTAFQEGKEYLLCFSVEDNDNTTNRSIKCYPQSISMERTGDYVAVGANDYDDGIVYKLFQEKYANKWLTARAEDEYVMDKIAKEYEAGRNNWKYESMSGSARFYGKYLRAGLGATDGSAFGIRIKSPGTGNYKITLKYMKGFEPSAADVGEVYIMEAPEKTIPGSEVKYYLAGEPVMEMSYSCNGTRFQKASANGTFMFQEDKEYIVLFHAGDGADKTNTTGNAYMFLDRLVMKRIGEYVEKEKVLNEGGIVAENVLTQFSSEAYMLTTINDHDYLVFGLTGGTMLIYDLDEWRLVDEVKIDINTPRAMCQDLDGNWWITGNSQALYCYNPYTREGFMTGKISGGGDHFHIACDPEDGSIYFSAYSTKGILIYRVNPKTLEVTKWNMESWSRYPGPGSCTVIGNYLYLTASSGDHCEVWKVDKRTMNIVDRVDITHRTKGERYVYYMSNMGENHLLVYSAIGLTVVDTRDMSLIYGEDVGIKGTSSRIASQPIDGKCYFVTNAEGLCYFDLETETFGAVGGELANYKTGLRVPNLATIDDSRLTEKTMLSFGGMSASGVSLYALNLETKISVELIGLVEPGMGTGVNAHTLFKGEPGTNEIIYGPMYPSFPARVYNAGTGELAREFMTNGQNDSYVWYNGKMYFGNYNSAILTEMNNGQATRLFTLNDENFDQSRIHGICGGDNKVFIGTIPDNFLYGGVVAWYDLETELTYVVTGPKPEDVYYAKASKTTVTNEWYSAVTNELVNMENEWDEDENGDGVKDSFIGLIPRQSIVKVVYSDGLLYGVSSLRAGSGALDPTNTTSMIFIYDVENMKLLKTVDLANYIDGVPSEIYRIKSLEADPEISNKMWGMVAETLFTMTYDRDTNKVTIKEEISFNKNRTSKTSSICTPMIFDGDYIYALFGSVGGLLKINRKDTTQYTRIMGDFQTTRQVPTDFVLGDDGDIYYISNSSAHIYVLNVDITEEERASAKIVDDAIDLIPDVVTLADRGVVEAARAAWDAMPKANQPLVKNLEKLENAEIALLTLRIDALNEHITIEDEQELLAIRAEYMALDLEHRLRIDFNKVSQAESKMSILRGERTTGMIASIGQVTLDKEQLIRDARASYMALSRYERTLVTNIDALNAAEAVLMGLILEKNEGASVAKRIDEIGLVLFSNAKIKIARTAYDKLSDGAKDWVENYGTLVAAEIILVAEYILSVAIVAGGVLLAIPATRKKILKKKAKAE